MQTNAVRNLGVIFDCNMSMSAQVNKVAKSANYHLVNIPRARKMLTTESTILKIAVHALVASRIDYCNSLLAGISESLLKRLVNIHCTAARIITSNMIPSLMISWNYIGYQLSNVLTLRSLHLCTNASIRQVFKLYTLLNVNISWSSSIKFNCFVRTH